jgi:hypothetical protein
VELPIRKNESNGQEGNSNNQERSLKKQKELNPQVGQKDGWMEKVKSREREANSQVKNHNN